MQKKRLQFVALATLAILSVAPITQAQNARTANPKRNPGTPPTKISVLPPAEWQPLEIAALPALETHPYLGKVNAFRAFALDAKQLGETLQSAPQEFTVPVTESPAILALPTPTGQVLHFRFVESPILSTELAAQNPDIKTYCGQCIENPTMSTRCDVTLTGFHAMVYSPDGNYYVNPYTDGDTAHEVVFYDRDIQRTGEGWQCAGAIDNPMLANRDFETPKFNLTPHFLSGTTLHIYRLALSCTGEYSVAVAGSNPTTAAVQSKMVTSINRVDGVFELDCCIRLSLVKFNIYLSSSSVFTNNNGNTLLGQNQTVCDGANTSNTGPGTANYDIGHVFSTGGGGVAYRPCVCVAGRKAGGVTGSPSPVGDGFDIDYVIHEMGHQFGGDHTFNGTAGNCGGGNRASNAAYEPGSGSTIMAYAGICSTDDLQPHSDAYFHSKSLEQIITYRDTGSGGATCGSTSNTGNSVPTINVGTTYTIPLSTPFMMTATGTDANSDALTFCWEQYDLGSTTATTNTSSGVLFRTYSPLTSGTRSLPRLSDLLANASTPNEVLPTVARNIKFRCTVRDNRIGGGGVQSGDVTIAASGAAFSLTNRTTAFTWVAGTSYTVSWTVGGTTTTPKLDILFSTDGGATFTTLSASVPNTGSANIVAPSTPTTTGRIMLRGVDNIFFDVSRVAGVVKLPVPAITSLSPSSANQNSGAFTLMVNGSGFVNGSTVRWNGTSLVTTYVSATQLTAAVPASNLNTVGNAPVTVVNSTVGGGGGTSNSVNFSVVAAYSASGTITLQGLTNPSSQVVTLQFRPVGGGSNINTTATLDASGNFSAPGITPGNYNLAIKSTRWLQKVVPANLTSGNVTGISAMLLAGDIDGNNIVNVNDLFQLLSVFNTVAGDGIYNAVDDLNNDGTVDANDLFQLLSNFNVSGDN